MKAASGSVFAIAAALVAPLFAAGACSNEMTPHPPEIGGCTPTGDASCREIAVGGGAGGTTGEPDSGESIDAPAEPTDALPLCSGAADPTVSAIAASSLACADCLSATLDAATPSCCSEATACSADSGCYSIVTMCVLGCTNPMGCACPTTPASASTYNLLAMCAQRSCAGACPMVQELTMTD